MEAIPLKPERQAELEEFARRLGKTPAEALDEALAAYFAEELVGVSSASGLHRMHIGEALNGTRPATVELPSQKENLSLAETIRLWQPDWLCSVRPAEAISEFPYPDRPSFR